ncbi:GntR family transcriptional regulator [Actinobacillus equuli]|uniref:GntR family transcriptional regulator n=1 Tax=Actinobacillus equuli TaxID=718 RepID=UPI002442ACC5|nr:GntR family transcriptional regulator [Actinobacillus equuli]WGE59778.1 GntR family transcriptional regulator [Actinobacillus equuli subsp. haemolyticus]WGE61578.1 GntR family transcriptional regulator [Actinobacillus equuli subsp. haemolyticus]
MFNYDQKYVDLNKIPRYLQIKYELQRFLAENNWSFEKAIPSEQELAATYEVSIGTVRKAVEGLVEEGVLIKHQGKGTFLKHPAFVESSIVRFYLRNAKEGKPETPIGEVKCIKSVKANPKINQLLGEPVERELIYLERIRSVDNKVIVSDKIWLSPEKFGELLSIKPEQFENLLYPFYFKKCGQLVVSAKEQMTILLSHSDTYLTDGQEKTVIKVCRAAKGLDGCIIEYRESYGLAEDFYYETIIT